MKIAYWSPMHGTGATSNLLVTAISMSEDNLKKVLVTQNHFDMNNMEKPLLGNVDAGNFFGETGIDALIRHFKSGNITSELVKNCAIGISENLSLLAGTKVNSRQSFDTDIVRNMISKIINQIESFYDVVLVDTNSGVNRGSYDIMSECDLIVVTLRQNKDMIDSVMKNEFFSDKKVFYLFGNYDETSKYSLPNLRHLYKKIKKENSGGIPYSTGYMDAIADERVMRYLKSNMVMDEGYYESRFFSQIKEVTDKILKYAEK